MAVPSIQPMRQPVIANVLLTPSTMMMRSLSSGATSTIDLTDGGLTGGEMDVWSAGLNWWLASSAQVSANYRIVRLLDGAVACPAEPASFHVLPAGRGYAVFEWQVDCATGPPSRLRSDLLFDLMGAEGSQQLLYELKSESFGLAEYLERLHPGDILEVAFDFAIDREGRLRLLEINTKPGLAGIGSDVHLRDKRPEHEPLFERWVYPHTRHLARFLRSKVERLPA